MKEPGMKEWQKREWDRKRARWTSFMDRRGGDGAGGDGADGGGGGRGGQARVFFVNQSENWNHSLKR